MKAEKTMGANGYWLVRALWVGPTGTTMLHTHEVTGSSPVVSTMWLHVTKNRGFV